MKITIFQLSCRRIWTRTCQSEGLSFPWRSTKFFPGKYKEKTTTTLEQTSKNKKKIMIFALMFQFPELSSRFPAQFFT